MARGSDLVVAVHLVNSKIGRIYLTRSGKVCKHIVIYLELYF